MRFKFGAIVLISALGLAASGHNLAAQEASPVKVGAVSGSAPQDADYDSESVRAAKIKELIAQLGSDRFDAREGAQESLTEFGSFARAALESALDNSDPEIAARARQILATTLPLTHAVVDALGAPLPRAFVMVKIVTQDDREAKVQKRLFAESDDHGRIPIPPLDRRQLKMRAIVEIHHPDYGSGRYEVNSVTRGTELRFPLVRTGSDARARAVEGVVVDAVGRPIPGATVNCQSVRTPGQGLVMPSDPHGDALTDRAGRFVYYLPNTDRRGERGELISPNSNYQLNIAVDDDESLFPTSGMFSNLAPNTIKLNRATKYHRFQFQAVGGGWIEDPKLLAYITLQFDGDPAINQPRIALEQSAVTQGRLLLPGRYVATGFLGGGQMKYLPLDVTSESAEELRFLLPAAQKFRGRIVNGVTGEPLSGALVIAYNATAHNNLAMHSAADWQKLREIAADPDFDFRKENPLRIQYGVSSLACANDQGEFEIIQRPDKKFYGLIACAADYVPFNVRCMSLKTDSADPVAAGDFPLFPAAKVIVRPVHQGNQLSVSPKWLIDDAMQPEWIERFRKATDRQNREFEYVHWLSVNEPQPLFVPAGVRLRLKFESPYDDAWAPAVIEKPIQLKPGETFEIGDLHFAAALAVTVRVVDQNGQPLEGIPVRRRYDDGTGSVAHNTDAAGLAYFKLHPSSRGQFYIYDFPSPREQSKAENVKAKFEIADVAPTEPYEITLTAEQKRLLLEKPPPQR